FLLNGRGAEILKFVPRLGSILHTAALRKTLHQDLDEFWEFLIIAATTPLRFTRKSRHALRDISLKADSLLFAVVTDVDSRRCLFLNDMVDGFIHRLSELLFVYGAAFFALDEQIRKLVIARQAADMCDQNAFPARFHSA